MMSRLNADAHLIVENVVWKRKWNNAMWMLCAFEEGYNWMCAWETSLWVTMLLIHDPCNTSHAWLIHDSWILLFEYSFFTLF